MSDRRQILTRAVVTLVVLGLIAALIPFFASVGDGDDDRDIDRVNLLAPHIPEQGALEFWYRGDRVFVRGGKTIQAFVVPYWDGAYHLPNPTWQKAVVPCQTFSYDADGFACRDATLPAELAAEARWDGNGKSLGTWMPDLKPLAYGQDGPLIIFAPEYE